MSTKGICLLILTLACTMTSEAMVVEAKTLKSKASLVKNEKLNLFDFLDLKSKNIRFTSRDHKACQTVLYRKAETLKYSCALAIPTKAKYSKLNQKSISQEVKLPLGQQQKSVQISVSADGRKITFSTEFEPVGIDYEMTEFNADFHEVMRLAALDLFKKAMKKSLKLEVLEN